jgi:hypothetical protein
LSEDEGSALVCPRCGRFQRDDERFCESCGMPLVFHGAKETKPSSEAHERARKIRPRYAKGETVRVTGARNLAEAELIQGLLLEHGIPSILRRTRGFDVPDFLAAGPRDVLVPSSGYAPARDVLRDADLLTAEAEPGAMPGIGSPGRLAVGMLIAVALGALLFLLIYEATA